MASLECNHCGNGIHYHDIPDGTEYRFVPYLGLNEFFDEDLPFIKYLNDGPKDHKTVWKCSECGCLHLFDGNGVWVKSAYVPTSNSAPDNVEGGVTYWSFDDFNFEEISDAEITPKQLKDSGYQYEFVVVTDDFLHFYADKELTRHLRSYKAIELKWKNP